MTDTPGAEDGYLDRPYELAGRRIDPIAGTVAMGEGRTPINRKLLEVLACLAVADGEMVPRETFIVRVWRGNALIGETGLTNAVYALRRTLRDDDADKPLIRTIPRRGYRLSARARPIDHDITATFASGMPIAGRPGWRLSHRRGGNAVSDTWLAEDENSGERRVFRFCRSERHLQALRRETKLLRYLREALGPRRDIAVALDWQLDEPPYHLEMDAAAGEDLVAWAAARGGLTLVPRADRLRLASEIATALAAVHAAGVVHRNLCSTSILIDETGEDGAAHARVGEFGWSDVADRASLEAAGITRTGLTLSGGEGDAETLYLAPERVAGAAATTAGDVYALGALSLQLAAGDLRRSPDTGNVSQVEDQALRTLLLACLDPRPERRPDAATVAARLRALAPSPRDGGADAVAANDVSDVVRAEAIEAPAADADAAVDAGESEPSLGRSIGPYRLLDRLGEGGMGIVFLAEQRAPVQRKVALKLVRSGLMSADVRARFEAERQALALMSHANVATVFDAGSTPVGQPYFAMEYVQGQEITAHCDRMKLDVRARIELFLQVCEGILHAHQKGLIHRDLKPANILVSRALDGGATAKIIDFGVAKSISGMLAAQPAYTRLGSFVGTPAYSSPEQVSGPLASVDTRSDIYSLGVVLYELMAGVTPYKEEELNRKTPVELARLLSGEQPPTPLARFASLDPDEERAIADRRSSTTDQLKALLETDVSWIVGKCLEADPDDRYPSVLELENDLRRWLQDEPVRARPASRWYRMRKFVRRHRTGVALASLGALALFTASTAAVVGFVRAERALTAERVASVEAKMAAEFQVKQIQGLDPATMGDGLRRALKDAVRKQAVERGRSPAEAAETARALEDLVKGVNFTDLSMGQINAYNVTPALRAIDKDYRDQPLLQAQLWTSTADTLFLLGQYNAAVAPYERALEQRRRLLGAHHPLTLETLEKRGKLRRELGDFPGSVDDLRAAMNGDRRVLGPDAPQTLAATHALAMTLFKQGKLKEALPLARDALAGRRRVLGEQHPETLASLRESVALILESGDTSRALTDARASLQTHRRTFGEDDNRTLKAMSTMAMVYRATGKPAEAEALVRELIETRRRILGDAHPETLRDHMNLSMLLREANRPAEAEAELRKVLEISRTLNAEDSWPILDIQGEIAYAITEQGRYADAESLYRAIFAAQERTLGKDSMDTLRSANNLARALGLQGRFKDAAEWYRKALDARRRLQGDAHPNTLLTIAQLAYVLQKSGDFRGAEALRREVMETNRRTRGADAPETLLAILDYGLLMRDRGDLAAAETSLREVLAIQRRILGEDKPDTLITIAELIGLLRDRGELEEAATLGERLTEAAPRAFDAKDAAIGGFYAEHALTLIELRRFDQAERMLDRAKANFLQAIKPSAAQVDALMDGYITLYARWHAARPAAGYDAKAALWRERRKALAEANTERPAELLAGAPKAN